MDELINKQSAVEFIHSLYPKGWVHINDIYRLISGHSNYHGDNILAALTCLSEGKEVLKPIKVLDIEPKNSNIKEEKQDGEATF